MKIKRLLAVLLSAVLMLSLVPMASVVSAEGVTPSADGNGYMMENDALKLEIAEDGAVTLTEKATGTTYNSRNAFAENDNYSSGSMKKKMKSETVIDCYFTKEALTNITEATAYSCDAEIAVAEDNDKIKVTYDFVDMSVRFAVFYAIGKDNLEVNIDFKSLEEYGDYSVARINLLPGFASGTGYDNGYIFVPDGSGALIEFNNNADMTYRDYVYGKEGSEIAKLKSINTEKIYMPVFGMIKNGAGFVAIIEEGDAIAEIIADSKNDNQFYNAVSSIVDIRYTFTTNLFGDTNNKSNASTAYSRISLIDNLEYYTVKYHFLSGNNANYIGMAEKYREYLINDKGLEKKAGEPVLNIDVIGAIDAKANFLGFSYFKPYALTEYSQIETIIEALKEKGVDDIGIRYIGWYNNGITNKKILTKVKPIGALGGKKDLKALNSYAQKNEIDITYDIEFMKFLNGRKKYAVSSPFKEKLTFSPYLRSVYATDNRKRSWNILSSEYWDKNFASIKKSLNKLAIDDISLAMLTSSIYSDFNVDTTNTKTDVVNSTVKLLDGAKDKFSLKGESANAYTVPYLSKIYKAPTYTSGYYIFDEEIPFYQIVLHGYIDLTAMPQYTSDNRQINYLKAIESGSQLLYTGMAAETKEIVDTDYDYLYGTNYKLWMNDAAEKYAKYQPLLKKIYDSAIVSHHALQKDVYETTYENGVSIIVNYNDEAVEVDGVKIEKYDFYERVAK